MLEKKKIGVIGAGIMGKGIALVFAEQGYNVLLSDLNDSKTQKAFQEMSAILEKDLQKGRISLEDKERALKNIVISESISDFSNCDLVIEAIVEKQKDKQSLLKKLDQICDARTILATNTSTILISQLAKSLKRKDKFIGIHFINPARIMKLVEITPGPKTSLETARISEEIIKEIKKDPIISQDSPGFVLNRILFPIINQAAYCLQTKVAGKEEIDKALKLGANFPMGPLELADLIGIDTCLLILQELDKKLPNNGYKPCPIFKKMVKAKELGRKTKKGFYQY